MKKVTEATMVPVVQVVNVLKNRYCKGSAQEVNHRISEDYRKSKAEKKNVVRVFGPDGCFILCEVKSNGKLTAHGRRLREAFLNGYK